VNESFPALPAAGGGFHNVVKVGRTRFFAVVFFAFYLTATWGYRVFSVGEIRYTEDFRTRYASLLLTDTIEYYNFNKFAGNDWMHKLLQGNLKNYLGPVLLIRLLGDVPFGDLLANNLLVLCATVVLIWLLEYLGTGTLWPLVLLLCNPAVFVYSQGFNKEIPLVLCVMLFALATAKRNIVLSVIAIFLTFIFRTQLAAFFTLFLFFHLFYIGQKKNGLFIWLLSIPLAFAFPFLYGRLARLFLEFSDIAYGSNGGFGIGQIVTAGLLHIPFFAYIGLPVHAAQNMLEPVWNLKLDSVPSTLSTLSAMLVIPFFAILSGQVLFNTLTGRLDERRYYSIGLHLLVVLGILFVAINPFVHSRYLFCFSSLLPLAIKKTRSTAFNRAVGIPAEGNE
jgi:hypothetical protein